MAMKKMVFWKAVFLLVLFIIGIMIGSSVNKTKMQLIQGDQNNELVLDNLKECCMFIGADGNKKVCKALSTYTCDQCNDFCDSRTK